jgi:HK97 family phage portal protein
MAELVRVADGMPPREFRAMIDATPPGAARPSSTFWARPGLPPVSWAPSTGVFETHWDWQASDAMAIPAVWRARMLISQAIGGMPLGAWKGSVALEPVPSLLAEPNPGEDRCSTVAAWVCDLLDHGNALGYVTERNAEGKPTAVAPWPACKVEIGRDPDSGNVYYRYDGSPPVSSYSVFHAKGTHRPGDLRGMGVLEAGLTSITRMSHEASYASRAFTTGTPSGLLRVKDPDLQAGDPDDPAGFVTAHGIKKSWQSSVATGDIAVMSELVDFQPLSWTPSDAQMIEARQMSLVDTANLFNLDPYWVGASQVSAPYQNVQQAALQLSRFGLGFWITSLEAQFSRMLPRGTEARFNRDSILRDEMTTRVGNYVQLLNAGVVTVDEVRALEGLPPMPGTAQTLAPVTPLFPDGDAGTNQAVS